MATKLEEVMQQTIEQLTYYKTATEHEKDWYKVGNGFTGVVGGRDEGGRCKVIASAGLGTKAGRCEWRWGG